MTAATETASADRGVAFAAPVGRLGHVAALDGVRGIAIGAVVLYHAYGVPGGFLGVDLFFVLSGFLITTLLLENHADRGTVDLRRFYVRRARRLLPVALAGIVFAEGIMLAAALVGLDPGRQLLGGLFAALYVENLAHYFDPPIIVGLGHYWSLSQEEQFYLLWPPILALLLRRRVPAWCVVTGVAVIVAAVIVHRALLADAGWWRWYYAPDTRADGILLGCLLALAWKAGWLRESRLWRAIGPAAFVVFAIEVVTLDHTTPAAALSGITVANLAAAGIVVSVVMAPTAPLARLLTLAPIAWVGLISYSLYIWGSLVGWSTGLHGSLLVVVSVAVAWLSYRYVERPFRRGRGWSSPSHETNTVAAPSRAAAASG